MKETTAAIKVIADANIAEPQNPHHDCQGANMKTDVAIQTVNEDDELVPRVDGVPLSRLVAYFLRLGTVGFGGPIALVGYMQRDLVEDKHWVSNEDYLEGLAFSQLSPGPLAAQLANYLGWVHSGTLGATLA